MGLSERWRAEKPSAEFFRRLAEQAGFPPEEIGYVGDRVDNDVAGAAGAGMVAILLRRGPWAVLRSESPEATRAAITVRSLEELPEALRRWRR
ncbi:MAG: HAD family hydrolase [Actinomycetota bacterium]